MTDQRTFLRIAAIASALSALTTLVLIFATDFYRTLPMSIEGRMMRVTDPAYQLRAWTYQIHPVLVFTACLGLWASLRRQSPSLALGGVLAFGLWALTEAAQQSLTLFAFDDWRRAWIAGDPAVRATIELRSAIYDGLWEAAYSLLLWGIILGSALFAVAFLTKRDWLSRAIGALFAIAALQSLLLQSGELGGPALPPEIGKWVYALSQPIARLLTGVWLWRVASGHIAALKPNP